MEMVETHLGHYHLLEQVGQGSMAAVYRARDMRLDRIVALKVLSPSLVDGPVDPSRLHREARSAARLTHPNIIAVFDIGQEGKIGYIAMEYVEGKTLRQALAHQGSLPLDQVVPIAIQVCQGLAHAHRQGVVHGDLKPGNLMLTADGRVKIADFGLARDLGWTPSEATEVQGTLAYLAPEAISGRSIDGRTDLYSLGAVLYECLSGHPPFSCSSTISGALQAQLEANPAALRALQPALPDAVDRLVLKLLEKEPDQRYQTAETLLEDLGEFLDQAAGRGREQEESRLVPLVGRGEELTAMRAAVEQMRAGRGGLVLVEGEAGIGKSRLLAAFSTDQGLVDVEVLRANCLEGGAPYQGFVQALMGLMGIEASDPDIRREEKLRRYLREEDLESEEAAPVLQRLFTTSAGQGTWGGFPRDEAAAKQQLFWSVWRLLVARARCRAVVMLLEDLHEADPGTVEMLDFAVRQVEAVHLLIVATYRPEALAEDRVPRGLRAVIDSLAALPPGLRLVLQRLEEEETVRLVSAFLGDTPVPAAVAHRLQQETEGHPLFVVETLKWMQTQGLVRKHGTGWAFQYLDAQHSLIPRSLRNLIRSRFGQLAAREQEVLRCAAVAGVRFSVPALTCVVGLEEHDLHSSLDQLEHQHRMIRREGENYLFSHAKIREVLYEDIAPELKQGVHLLLGQYLEDLHHGRCKPVVFELAEHFYAAGVRDKARVYLVRAGDQAREVYAHQQAVHYYQRALELAEEESQEAELSEKLGAEYYAAGELDKALEYYTRLLKLVKQPHQRAQIHHQTGRICELAQQREESRQHLEQALGELNTVGTPIERVRIWLDLSYLCVAHFNDFRKARELDQKCLAILSGTGHCAELVHLYRNLANVSGHQGRLEEAHTYCQQRLALAEELGNRREETLACMDLGSSCDRTGDFAQALHYLQRAVDSARRLGDLSLVAAGLQRQGEILLVRRGLSLAEPVLHEALEISSRMGYVHLLGSILNGLASEYLQRGEGQKTCDLLVPGLERMVDLGVEGVYAVRCFCRVLEDLQRACEMLGRPAEFAALCRKLQGEHAGRMESCQPQHWFLEPDTPPFDAQWQIADEEPWRGEGYPAGWTWAADVQEQSTYSPTFGPAGLAIAATRHSSHVVQNYERNYDPPRLTRGVAGDCALCASISAVSAEVPRSGGLIAWKDADNYALLAVDQYEEVQLYVKERGLFRIVGRGHLPGARHSLGWRREGSRLTSLCSADGQNWWTAGSVLLEGEEVQFGLYPHTGTIRAPSALSVAARYGPLQLARKEVSMTMEEHIAPSPASARDLLQDELAALCRISRTINATLDLDQVLDQVLDAALEVTGAERGLVLLREENTQDLQTAAMRDLDGDTRRDAAAISQRIVADAAGGGVPILALDAGGDERFQPYESVVLHHIRSVMCLPLRVRDRVIGTLYLDHRVQTGIFAESSLFFYQAMADQIAIAVENARLYSQLQEENVYLRREVEGRYRFASILGESPTMERVFALLEKVIASPSPVVLVGESGTGKELVARALHYEGPRRGKRFVAENCAALPDPLLESELFGHAKGAFTGADRDKKGLFEAADGGTLFLDEIADTSPAVQAKLLRALEAGEIRRLGETDPRKVDVRLVVATSRDLLEEVRAGRFRAELYYRLHVLAVHLPPLRQRREDIPLLADHFLQDYARRTGKDLPGFSRGVVEALTKGDWPGNVRELRNEVERMAALAEPGAVIGRELLSEHLRPGSAVVTGQAAGEPLSQAMARIKREMIEEALRQCGNNRSRTAERLGLTRSNLQMMMKRLGIK